MRCDCDDLALEYGWGKVESSGGYWKLIVRGNVQPSSVAWRFDGHLLPLAGEEGSVRGELVTVNLEARFSPDDRNERVSRAFECGSGHGKLPDRPVWFMTDEQIGRGVAIAIERSAGRNAKMPPTGPGNPDFLSRSVTEFDQPQADI